ncbi:MAG TPA: hypothetical protein VHF06_37465 [Pseudonocardiaceae bacterium]|jgi:hypothetical protein|nr:hypothetical protein [Pseudonocardiaceae bacterium]
MSRARLAYLPVALALAGSVVLPSVAFAAGHDDPPTACTKDTQEVTNLSTVVTNLGTALKTTPPDPTTLSQVAGDLFNAVTAAQTAGCLPALPTSPPATPAPPAAHPQDATKCAADAVQLLSAALGEITAGTAATPDPTAVLTAATNLATAITAVNTDACLPVSLPVPSVPTPPAPPIPPVS